VDVERDGVDVHEDWPRSEIDHDLAGGGEGVGRDDHLVARLESNGVQRKVHRGRGRVDGDGVLGTDELGELALEALGARAGREPAASEGVDALGDLVLFDAGPMKRQPVRAYRRAAIEREPLSDHVISRPGGQSEAEGYHAPLLS